MSGRLALAFLILVAGCASPTQTDPVAALASPSLTGGQHRRALQALDQTPPDDPATLDALSRVVSQDGYTIEVREAALERLAQRDLERLKAAIRRTLPRTAAWGWITRLSQIIAERGWTDLSPALVSSWARPVMFNNDDLERPEYLALASMHGAENVTDVVFAMLIESKGVGEQGLRSRCWDLLHRLGQRERLVELLASREIAADDPMLLDLQAGAAELGLVPRNREEILWMRKLREPQRAEFWSQAVAAVQGLNPQRRAELALRDLPIVVSASLHDRELLALSVDELHRRVDAYLRTQRHHVEDETAGGFADTSRQRLGEYEGKLSWGDLAAMLVAIRAMQVPEVVDHLFDFAERDRADESTEYGGVIALDAKDRFEVREFVPVFREHDQRFNPSQAMFDAGYTAVFHFHNHTQNHRNERYAGPGIWDLNTADNTRANCLVFTFVNRDTLNVDYYRHDRVVVDLGEIRRRGS